MQFVFLSCSTWVPTALLVGDNIARAFGFVSCYCRRHFILIRIFFKIHSALFLYFLELRKTQQLSAKAATIFAFKKFLYNFNCKRLAKNLLSYQKMHTMGFELYFYNKEPCFKFVEIISICYRVFTWYSVKSHRPLEKSRDSRQISCFSFSGSFRKKKKGNGLTIMERLIKCKQVCRLKIPKASRKTSLLRMRT